MGRNEAKFIREDGEEDAMKSMDKRTKEITGKFSLDEARKLVMVHKDKYDPIKVVENVYNVILPSSRKDNSLDRGRMIKVLKEVDKASIAFEFDTHLALVKSVGEEYQALAADFCEKLIQEYECTTSSEKALVELVAGSFVRHLQYANLLNNFHAKQEFTQLKINCVAMLSKELDRSQRIFLSALTSLRLIKTPNIPFNVKATTAFIAEHQQVNAIPNPTFKEGKTNDGQ